MIEYRKQQYNSAVAYNILSTIQICWFIILIMTFSEKFQYLNGYFELSEDGDYIDFALLIVIFIQFIVITILIQYKLIMSAFILYTIYLAFMFIFFISYKSKIKKNRYFIVIDSLLIFIIGVVIYISTFDDNQNNAIIISFYLIVLTIMFFANIGTQLNILRAIQDKKQLKDGAQNLENKSLQTELNEKHKNQNTLSEIENNSEITIEESQNTEVQSNSENSNELQNKRNKIEKMSKEEIVEKLTNENICGVVVFIIMTIMMLLFVIYPCDPLKFYIYTTEIRQINANDLFSMNLTGIAKKIENSRNIPSYFFKINETTNEINLCTGTFNKTTPLRTVGIIENNMLIFYASKEVTTKIDTDYMATFVNKLITINGVISYFNISEYATVRFNRTNDIYFDNENLMISDFYIFDKHLDTIANINSAVKIKVYHSIVDGCDLIYPGTTISIGNMSTNKIINIHMQVTLHGKEIFLKQNNALYYLSPVTNQYIIIGSIEDFNYI